MGADGRGWKGKQIHQALESVVGVMKDVVGVGVSMKKKIMNRKIENLFIKQIVIVYIYFHNDVIVVLCLSLTH